MAGTIDRNDLFDYCLRLGDNSLILGQRLSEWCAKSPEMELDVALMNTSLDLLGRARGFLTYAGEVEGRDRDEDALAFLRDQDAYRNVLLVEQPNGHFGTTMARQFLFDAFDVAFMEGLAASADETLAAIAAKAVKESRYHLRFSRDWLVRLGDGTEESHARMVEALETVWPFHHELFEMDDLERRLVAAGVAVDREALKDRWDATVDAALAEATLARPDDGWAPGTGRWGGGKAGNHTEHLGFLLAEMQWMQRAYPGQTW